MCGCVTAAALQAVLAYGSTDNRSAVLTAGGVPRLVALLGSGAERVRRPRLRVSTPARVPGHRGRRSNIVLLLSVWVGWWLQDMPRLGAHEFDIPQPFPNHFPFIFFINQYISMNFQ